MTNSEMPEAFWQGVEQFNQQQFYDCHDTLEALWMEAEISHKPFYQGILQIAVAFYHLGNHNWRGAVILLGEGINRLQPYPSTYGGIDVDQLLDQSMGALSVLQQAGPERVADLVRQFKQVDVTADSGGTALHPPKILLAST